MDLFNNEIIAYYLTDKKGDPEAYHAALNAVLKKKIGQLDFYTILHTDQGSVYCSKRFNKNLERHNIIHSMSKPGTPTENGAMSSLCAKVPYVHTVQEAI